MLACLPACPRRAPAPCPECSSMAGSLEVCQGARGGEVCVCVWGGVPAVGAVLTGSCCFFLPHVRVITVPAPLAMMCCRDAQLLPSCLQVAMRWLRCIQLADCGSCCGRRATSWNEDPGMVSTDASTVTGWQQHGATGRVGCKDSLHRLAHADSGAVAVKKSIAYLKLVMSPSLAHWLLEKLART